MSNNFFAALDDSGDEAPAPKTSKAAAAAPKDTKPNKATTTKKVVVEPSKVDDAKRPNSNDRNTKFGRGGRAPPRDGKRAYERRSGTGRGKEIKKGGGGARNWGSDKNEARQAAGHVEEKDVTEPVPETSEKGEEPDAGAEDAAEEEAAEPEAPPEDKTLSYEEYLEQKKQQQAESKLFKPVQERQVENAFANAKPKESVEEDFLVMGGGKEKKSKAKTKEIKTVETGFRVEPNASNAGRLGGGRGGRGRGGGRGGGDRESSSGRGGGRGEFRGGGGGRGGGEGRGGGRGGRGGGGRGDGRGGPRGSGRGGFGGRTEGGGRGRGSGGLNVNDTQAFPSL